MTKIQLLVSTLFFLCMSLTAVALPTTQGQHFNKEKDFTQLLSSEFQSAEAILELTPKKYKEITGKRMKLKEIISLKVIQHQMRAAQSESPVSSNDIPEIVLLILCIIPPLAVFLVKGISGSFWLSCLLMLGALVIGIFPFIGGLLAVLLYLLAIAHAVMIVLDYI